MNEIGEMLLKLLNCTIIYCKYKEKSSDVHLFQFYLKHSKTLLKYFQKKIFEKTIYDSLCSNILLK